MAVTEDGLRQRPVAAASFSASVASDFDVEEEDEDDPDMAYGSVRSRPVLATSIRRTISSGLYNSNSVLRRYYNRIFIVFAVTAIYTIFIYKSGASSGARIFYRGEGDASGMKALRTGNRLQIATWNVAAINNNPFEYWITYKENPAYEQLMIDVEKFLEAPGAQDVLIPQVFTPKMLDALDKRLTTTAGWKSVRTYWDEDFSKRKIVEGFMKDPLLGKKRLASMPDRYTNTINTDDGQTVFRPTVINMYEDDLSTQDIWWKKWEKFMFDTPLKIMDSKSGKVESRAPFALLKPIKKSKYPEITEEEEKDSLPLQTMCGAIFDAILVHMMNTVSKPDVWQPLKKTMVENLNRKKIPHTLEILEHKYIESDIITLQEVSSMLIDMAKKGPLGKKFHIVSSVDMDPVRDQNSVICLNRATFPKGDKFVEITKQIKFPDDAPISSGDVLAITTESVSGTKYVIASFHGDTDGLATKPVTAAILQTISSNPQLKDHKLLFGLDANTYQKISAPGKQLDVLDFESMFVEKGLTSCWGEAVNPANYTTYNARTYLQPQLNKACRQSEKRVKGDVNPKDFILFFERDFKVVYTWKDNTGEYKYIEDMAFPTLNFPSDHGILATIVEPITVA